MVASLFAISGVEHASQDVLVFSRIVEIRDWVVKPCVESLTASCATACCGCGGSNAVALGQHEAVEEG